MTWECETCGAPTEQRSRGVPFCSLGCLREQREETETELVNLRHAERTCTRRIDRATRFGNPFRMKKDGGEYTREGCVDAYREWFHDKIDSEPAFRSAVEELRGETLGCWCKPAACHGDVILEYLEGGADDAE